MVFFGCVKWGLIWAGFVCIMDICRWARYRGSRGEVIFMIGIVERSRWIIPVCLLAGLLAGCTWFEPPVREPGEPSIIVELEPWAFIKQSPILMDTVMVGSGWSAYPGERMMLFDEPGAFASFSDKAAQVIVGRGADITLEKLSFHPSDPETRIRLNQGELYAQVDPQAGEGQLVVASRMGSVYLETGGKTQPAVWMRFDPGLGKLWVATMTGRVEVQYRWRRVQLEAGETMTIEALTASSPEAFSGRPEWGSLVLEEINGK
jgi:hypothetical protein